MGIEEGMMEKRLQMTAENLQAIREGRKTQTRRVIKPQPEKLSVGYEWRYYDGWLCAYKEHHSNRFDYPSEPEIQPYCKSSYQVGDLAWIPETWKIGAWRFDIDDGKGDRIAIDYKASPEITHTPWIYPEPNIFDKLIKESQEDCIKAYEDNLCGVEYDDRGLIHNYTWEAGQSPCRWRNSRFMYKCFAREWVRITGVRVERLQDISEEDAKAEGVWLSSRTGKYIPMNCDYAVWAFEYIWNEINGKTYPWSSNPWVWVYDLERRKR